MTDDKITPVRQLLATILAQVPVSATRIAETIRARTAHRFHAEMTAFAGRAEVSWQQVMLASVSYDYVMHSFGCSTVALPTPDGPVLARNMDWWPESLLAKASCVMRYESPTQDQAARLVIGGWPGGVGVVTGLSSRGFALALNAAVMPGEGSYPTGYPVLLFLRTVLEDASDFEDALDMLQKIRLFVGGLITLVGTRNDQRVCVERTPTRVSLRWGEPGRALVTTNDYRQLTPSGMAPRSASTDTDDPFGLYRSACRRFDALTSGLANAGGEQPITDEELLYHLSSPEVRQEITAQHIIARPAEGTLRLFVPTHLLEASPAV